MRKFTSYLILSILSVVLLKAQIVTTTPTFPSAANSVDIIFDAALSTGGLKDYTGTDVYAHTGVITDKSNGNWAYAPAWGTNTEKYKLTSLGNNKWKLSISPNIRSYYGVPTGEKILKMVFVFRNANASKEGKDNGKDIFVDVYESGLTVAFSAPSTDQLLDKNTSLSINANSSTNTTLKLLLNNTTIASASNATTISHTYKFATEGSYWLIAEAGTSPSMVRDSIFVNVKKGQVTATRPAKTRDGINIIDDNTATFVLYAPSKSSVFLIGDFNDWKAKNDYMLNKDGDYWWITVNNLEKGKEYAFQYLVDGNLKIADPYTDKILDPWNDQYISASVYPNLKPYPKDKTEEIVSIVQTGQSAYNWKIKDFKTPAKDKLVIYELLIRDFTAGHTFESTMEKLDYLQTLGVNTIELLPINEFEGNSSWGYNPSFYFAVDKYYGPKDSFKAFVDECHRRGMAVVIDMVLNHSFGQSPFVRLYWDAANDRPAANNPWYNVASPNTAYGWGADINHESAQTKALVDSINSYWMKEYNVDGFRFDFTKGFTNKKGDGWAYDQSRIDILKRMTSEIYKRKSDAIVIFEHLADNSEEKVLADADILLWGNMNNNYCEAIMGYTEDKKTDLSWALYSERGWTKPNLVSYMESHDEERIMYKAETWGKVTNEAGALKRAALSAAFYLTLPGPKMIWQFGELGYDYSINTCSDGVTIKDDCRVAEKPIRWDYESNANRKALYDVYSRLNDVKRSNAVFESTDISYSLTDAVKYFVWKTKDMNAFVVGNFGDASAVVNVTLPKAGVWYDLFDDSSVNIASTNYSATLKAGEYRFYVDKKALSGIETENNDEVSYVIKNNTIYLHDNNIRSVAIFNIGGQLNIQSRDTETVNISSLNTGVYILKIQTERGLKVSKFIKQ